VVARWQPSDRTLAKGDHAWTDDAAGAGNDQLRPAKGSPGLEPHLVAAARVKTKDGKDLAAILNG